MTSRIGIIDVFAGPGGLGEGFTSFQTGNGDKPFRIGVSAEMEASAHSTLRLRSFVRSLREREGPDAPSYAAFLHSAASDIPIHPQSHFEATVHADIWKGAAAEALNLTLGETADDIVLYEKIRTARKKFDELILIGGPPCQAYSLVGRARQKNVPGFTTTGDKKHFLYLEYLKILAKFRPAVFIMENVKGILTSSVGGDLMFDRIRKDLAHPSATVEERANLGKQEYVLLPIHVPLGDTRDLDEVARDPSQLIIRCENHGLPQARHRVIIMGVRSDLAHKAFDAPGLTEARSVAIESALAGLPKVRSGISREPDSVKRWSSELNAYRKLIAPVLRRRYPEVAALISNIQLDLALPRASVTYGASNNAFARDLRGEVKLVLNHSTRSHMAADLGRYLFVSAFGAKEKRSPKSSEFPEVLTPNHANWSSGAFADRFRVQLKKKPSNTITSHLSKDGHAFVHWDVGQCRSLTVREAARLQTFPDDYLFLGNRTQQFVQVGNAVPPLIASQIAKVVWDVLK